MLELWKMQSIMSVVQSPLWPVVVEPDRVLSMDYIELICVLTQN